ncbi:hypothetical protein [Mycolicibacterium smegmatis]|uniref:Uncharacterized protein n=1 Tax=Mycolicibacterium smegmatis (strain MKD8) TaxID=1214915 RepID=A0A2U9PH58_MYCSE|nr:hypothetical protein [Mycolicibacterium smegmatis]AWT51071.1 hypothetical protein D806_000770 [Mycolicibacterium smegmatis MKD8]
MGDFCNHPHVVVISLTNSCGHSLEAGIFAFRWLTLVHYALTIILDLLSCLIRQCLGNRNGEFHSTKLSRGFARFNLILLMLANNCVGLV